MIQGGFTPFTRACAISWPKCSCAYLYTPMAYGLPSAPVLPRGQAAMAKFERASIHAGVMTHFTEGFAYVRAQLGNADINGARAASMLRRIARRFDAINRKHLPPDQALSIAHRKHRREQLRDVVAPHADIARSW